MPSRCRMNSLVFAILALYGCSEDVETLSDADVSSVRAIDSTYVARILARDWQGVTALLTDDAVFLPPNATAVVGKDANLARLQTFQFDSLTYAHHSTRVEGVESIAYLEGRYRIRMSLPGALTAFADSGKHLWVLLRQPGGEWRIRSIIWNSDIAPPSGR
jgi:ketosteroid isomerase-like protein